MEIQVCELFGNDLRSRAGQKIPSFAIALVGAEVVSSPRGVIPIVRSDISGIRAL